MRLVYPEHRGHLRAHGGGHHQPRRQIQGQGIGSGPNSRIHEIYTVCPRSSAPFFIGSYSIKWVTTSWTHSISQNEFIFTFLQIDLILIYMIEWR